MRIALIADIHGNRIALETVLADIGQAGVDQIFCLGDVAALGPQPAQATQILREMDIPCILGNHDAFMGDMELAHKNIKNPIVIDAMYWCRERLSPEDIDFLAGFPVVMEVDCGADGTMLLCHGSPRSYMEDIVCTTEPEELDAMLKGYSPLVTACGHSHIQMLRQHKGMLIVNPGAVGLPFKEFGKRSAPEVMCHAEYAIVDLNQGAVRMDLRRLPLDPKALADSFKDFDTVFGAYLAAQYSQ